MSIQMLSTNFAPMLAHFFNRHGYHTYWQWLEQLQNCGSEIPLGGLDGPYRILQDIICQQTLYQQAAEQLGLRPCQQVRGEIS